MGSPLPRLKRQSGAHRVGIPGTDASILFAADVSSRDRCDKFPA
jgi:hypothetical protein